MDPDVLDSTDDTDGCKEQLQLGLHHPTLMLDLFIQQSLGIQRKHRLRDKEVCVPTRAQLNKGKGATTPHTNSSKIDRNLAHFYFIRLTFTVV